MPDIPNRPIFKAAEVCEIAGVQPYILRTWEAEFQDLGMAKSAGAPRAYRRADVERVLRIKQLILGDGLTLAGARRRLLDEEAGAPTGDTAADDFAVLDAEARERIREIKRGLQWILGVLSTEAARPPQEFELLPQTVRAARPAAGGTSGHVASAEAPAKPAKKASRSKKE